MSDLRKIPNYTFRVYRIFKNPAISVYKRHTQLYGYKIKG